MSKVRNVGSAAEPALGTAEQARRSHVGLSARGRTGRGRGGRIASRPAGGSGMKLGAKPASALGASKLANPEEFFDF